MGAKRRTRAVRAAAKLQRAMDEHRHVRVRRAIKGADVLTGYVVRLGDDWALLAKTDDAHLDGYVALRTSDLRTVKRTKASEEFLRHALELRGQWPPVPPPSGCDLSDVRTVLESAASSSPLVTLFFEKWRPDVCYVGRVQGWTGKHVELLEITPQARWDEQVTGWRRSAITRVEFGGRYEAALFEVASAAPR